MSQLMPTSAAEAVANGAQLLDEKHPGWWRAIDLNTLMLSSCASCICGQLAVTSYGATTGSNATSNYLKYLNKLLGSRFRLAISKSKRRRDVVYGFNVPDTSVTRIWSYRDLEREWKHAIIARLNADKLSKQAPLVVQKERECARI